MRVIAFLALCTVAFGAMGYVIVAMSKAKRFMPPGAVNRMVGAQIDDEPEPQGFMLDAPVLISSLHDATPESLSGFIARIEREEAEQRQKRNTA